ncbi:MULTISPECIES: GspH/FimT family pseudopilin [Aeromonas]|uniref:GspH/FimT family pseudopilin n=1 Tax=Aeromonas TaxID=642 RepID=UPI0027DAEDA1|nr:GspH/FimT family pseudopilin [Aeromonas veronii]EKP0311323.1 GspH/FimT family pseudopilin [Aeromonas veronii]WMJ04214.1 GspH/FimT family pseudopilin [Aeromonas veronii]
MNVRGFTLIELMITVGIAAILLLVGLPSMSQRLAAERLDRSATELASAYRFARSEAVKLTLPVVLQGTENGGWVVMADSKLLRQVAAPAGGVVIKPFDPIQIAPTGSSHAEIILANRLGEQRVLCVAPSGQLLQGSCS